MNAKKILFLDPSGSSVQVTHNLCNALVEQGCEVEVFTAPYWARSVERCARKYRLNVFFSRRTQFAAYEAKNKLAALFWKTLRFFGHAWSMMRLVVVSRKYDGVHVQILTVPAFDGFCLWLISQRTPLAYTAHDLIPHDTRCRGLKAAIFRRIYRLPDVFFVHTAGTAEGLTKSFGVAPEKIIRIRHGNLQHLLELPAGSGRVGEKPVLLFLGKIRRDKGLDVLLEAAATLRDRRLEFKVLVAGHPHIDMAPIFRFVKERELETIVEFRLGYIEEADLPGYFSQATLVVLPYREVAQSGVAIGACTFGKAIVATKCGGLEEMVGEAGNGLLVSLDNAEELARAIAQLLANPALRREMEKNSRAYALGPLSWQAIAKNTIEGYEGVLKP